MIIGTDVITPKIASATSTYPAVIVSVLGDVNTTSESANIKLKFYCPSIMSGSPKTAILSSVNNNVVAPLYPHKNATKYDYQVGGVILISFTDGDINSPQFVKFLPVSEDVMKTNRDIIETGVVVSDDLFTNITSMFSNLNDKLILRGTRFLKFVQTCAIGNSNTNQVMLLSTQGLDGIQLIRWGCYGTELIRDRQTKPNYSLNYKDNICFLDLCYYLCNNDTKSGDIYSLTKLLQKSISDLPEKIYSDYSNKIKYSYDGELKIWSQLAGFSEWSTGIKYLCITPDSNDEPVLIADEVDYTSPTQKKYSPLRPIYYDYENLDTEEQNVLVFKDKFIRYTATPPKQTTVTNIRDLTSYAPAITWNFLRYFQNNYKSQLDRYYSGILTNNIIKMTSNWSSDINHFINIMNAIVITAYPTIEDAVLSKYGYRDNELLKNIYDGIASNINKDSNSNITSVLLDTNKYASYYRDLYLWFLGIYGKARTDFSDYIHDCINQMITSLCNQYNNIIQEFVQTTPSEGTGTGGTQKDVEPTPEAERLGVTGIIFPTACRLLTSAFGWREGFWLTNGNGEAEYLPPHMHSGLDIGARQGNNIYAIKEGTVKIAKYDSGRGNYVVIDHGEVSSSIYLESWYQHCLSLNVNVGDKVSKGQTIALVGTTGDSTGPHLHFEIHVNGTPRNPLDFYDMTKENLSWYNL